MAVGNQACHSWTTTRDLSQKLNLGICPVGNQSLDVLKQCFDVLLNRMSEMFRPCHACQIIKPKGACEKWQGAFGLPQPLLSIGHAFFHLQ